MLQAKTNPTIRMKCFMIMLILFVTGCLAAGCGAGKAETPGLSLTPFSSIQEPDEWRQSSTQVLKNLAPKEAFTLIEANNPAPVILDVRTPDEFAVEHLEKAVNMDCSSANFRAEIERLDRGKTYLVYCRTGIRSSNTLKLMAELNFEKVYNLSG